MDDIKWFIGFLVVIGIMWLGGKSKGPDRPVRTATTTPHSQAVSPASKKAVRRGGSAVTEEVPRSAPDNVISEITLPVLSGDPDISPLRGKLDIISVRRSSSPSKEYVSLRASSRNAEDIILTGLMLKSRVTFMGHEIPEAWTLPFPTNIGSGELVRLRPGGRAYIISGRSPNGQSFQLNKCTGYFEQGMNFVPSLPIRCPYPISEPLPPPPNELSDACYDYLSKLERCEVPPGRVPANLLSDGSCQAHLFTKISYNQCVTYHKDDPNFFQGNWRLYLDRDTRLWKNNREIIDLLDADGKLIDSERY